MSTDFRPLEKIFSRDLFDGRLEPFGVREHLKPGQTTERERCLTDGRNYLWVYIDGHGAVTSMTWYAPNGNPKKILTTIVEAFDVDIVSEYKPQYWGFETEEEMETAFEELARADKRRFCDEVVKFVRGEDHNITGTMEMAQAEIVKRLITENPHLATDDKLPHLIKAVSKYDRDAITLIDEKLLIEEDVPF